MALLAMALLVTSCASAGASDKPAQSQHTGAVYHPYRGPQIEMVVTGGPGKVQVTHTDSTGGQTSVVTSVPWSYKYSPIDIEFPYVLARPMDHSGSVTCKIYKFGKLVVTKHSKRPGASVYCIVPNLT